MRCYCVIDGSLVVRGLPGIKFIERPLMGGQNKGDKKANAINFSYGSEQESLDVPRDIATWAIPIIMGRALTWTSRKLNTTMSLQL